MEGHDPTNFRVLDLSGNGRHLTIGDGAGSSEPTKLTAKRGYQNEADSYLQLGSNAWTSNRITVEVLLQGYQKDLSGYVLDFRNGSTSQCILGHTGGAWFFSSGLAVPAARAEIAVPNPQGGVTHLVGRHNGTATDLFMTGRLVGTAATPTPPEIDAAASGRVFQSYAGATLYRGMYAYLIRLWDAALSDEEIRELNRKAKKELHRI